MPMHTLRSAITALASMVCLLVTETQAQEPTVRPLDTRSDRLLEIAGNTTEELVAEFTVDGDCWKPATIYLGPSVDAWRACDVATWNRAAVEGRIPAGAQARVWN